MKPVTSGLELSAASAFRRAHQVGSVKGYKEFRSLVYGLPDRERRFAYLPMDSQIGSVASRTSQASAV
eukprot:CAMPEP_0175991386 /NCGR_PEP_ID=MMETSP0108-20121206/52832_1 /TAXON_ID=195067 ORGANISM="Goniomonas pacifica, Strain CCMP1869" /NCGR_SAMPLE_ID=MMETSP0108 /ASSEMBLY_ACC=CAM_ASM_000204 /LENGTH=67 /DNA_ID=CAMNT_0017322961 /DNA_START=522 /DNA_END=725 /DNA_ORIENTATION=+